MGDLRKNRVLQTDFEGNKNLARKYLGKNSCTEKKKYLSWCIMLEKILHRCMSGKKFFSKGLGKKF